jgi:hypothetical protein
VGVIYMNGVRGTDLADWRRGLLIRAKSGLHFAWLYFLILRDIICFYWKPQIVSGNILCDLQVSESTYRTN